MRRIVLVLLVLVAICVAPHAARADDGAPNRAIFAVIIGSNRSVDADLQPLKYADDDAARYVDLFRLLGARTYLLARLDENTTRLHPQAAAEAILPRSAELERTLAQAAADVAQARARGVETLFYFLFAGHGSVRNGEGYLGLEDERLTGRDLATKVVAKVNADRFHFIVDACDSYLVAYPRGPGGERRPAPTLEKTSGLGDDPRVGLLLSSSSHRESHEWDGFQAGVFSHEVRSGLYGAADADGDGHVTYREIAAFVARANAAIPNERFRPEVHAHAPRDAQALVDLTGRLNRRVEIDGKHAGHYILEDARGVRIAETHTAPGSTVFLLRPAPSGHEYLRRVDDDTEYVLPADREIVALADLTPDEPRVRERGAAHEAFDLVFTEPFDESAVVTWHEPPPPPDEPVAYMPPLSPVRKIVGLGALGLGVASLAIGTGFSIASLSLAHGSSPTESQVDVLTRNDRIARDRTWAVAGFAAGGALAVTGLAVLLWPRSPVMVGPTAGGGYVGYGATF
ncbi:MAG TPA: caspase family protein [Labilithrix sp.]|jgi:hypothetical protein